MQQRLRLNAQVLEQHIALDGGLGDDAFAARAHDVDVRRLLVSSQVRLEIEMAHTRVVVNNPAAGGKSGAPHHVLPGGIARGIGEAQVGELAGQEGLNVEQLGHARACLGHFGNACKVLRHPQREVTRLLCVVKNEDGRTLHAVARNRHAAAAREIDHLHAAIV